MTLKWAFYSLFDRFGDNNSKNWCSKLKIVLILHRDKETGADDFAVEFLGCGIVAEGLKQLKEITVLLGNNDTGTKGAVKEIDLRLNRIFCGDYLYK